MALQPDPAQYGGSTGHILRRPAVHTYSVNELSHRLAEFGLHAEPSTKLLTGLQACVQRGGLAQSRAQVEPVESGDEGRAELALGRLGGSKRGVGPVEATAQ